MCILNVNQIVEKADVFYNEGVKDKNSDMHSWEHCYKCFYEYRSVDKTDDDYDYLSLQLGFYLASWGMYRGSSFLKKKDYKVHIPIVKELMKRDYDELFGIKCCQLINDDIMTKIKNLGRSMKEYYRGVRDSTLNDKVESDISDILITKILLGTLGCVPAYDSYFTEGVRKLKVTTGTYNKRSLVKLVKFYENNSDILESKRNKYKVGDLLYPQMKLLDMVFWQNGKEILESKNR